MASIPTIPILAGMGIPLGVGTAIPWWWIGFNDKFWFDFRGHPHTEQLHTIERYTRKDLGTLENKVTIIDPGDYSKPFTLTFTARLRPKEELMEYICQENQQDSKHMIGNSGPPENP